MLAVGPAPLSSRRSRPWLRGPAPGVSGPVATPGRRSQDRIERPGRGRAGVGRGPDPMRCWRSRRTRPRRSAPTCNDEASPRRSRSPRTRLLGFWPRAVRADDHRRWTPRCTSKATPWNLRSPGSAPPRTVATLVDKREFVYKGGHRCRDHQNLGSATPSVMIHGTRPSARAGPDDRHWSAGCRWSSSWPAWWTWG